MIKKCEICGVPFNARRKNSPVCDNCKGKRHNQQVAAYVKRRRANDEVFAEKQRAQCRKVTANKREKRYLELATEMMILMENIESPTELANYLKDRVRLYGKKA